MATPKDPLQYVTINDFRPGIYSDVRAAGPPGGGVLDAEKPGMAQEGTIGCITNSTGQLVPLPKGQAFWDSFRPGTGPLPLAGAAYTVGILAVGPINTPSQTIADDIFYYVNYHGLNGFVPVDCYQSFVSKGNAGGFGGATQLHSFAGVTISSDADLSRRGVSTVFTRGRRSTFTQPGFPITAWEYTSGEPFHDGAEARYIVYPDPNSLGTDAFYSEAYTVNNAAFALGGQLVPHSGRILRLCEALTQFGLSVAFESNERVRFTDPPGNIVLSGTTTDSILDPQIPGGFGSWGSISFGELLLIKRSGGALLVEGDVYAPQITRLPGVADVGSLTNVAVSTPTGLVYCCENDGAYVWMGGSTSQKISTINDRFHTPPETMKNGIKTDSELWNNWIVFTNGWLYDTVTHSWWRLDVTQALPGDDGLQWLSAGKGTQRYLYVIPGKPADGFSVNVGRYDYLTPSDTYTWISQPLPQSYGQSIDIREVDITLSNLTGNTTVYVTFFTLTGSVTPSEVFQVNGARTGPIRLRKPIGVIGESVYFSITASSTVTAPTLNCVEIGYIPATPFAQLR